MKFTYFHELLPKIAEKEIRVASIRGNKSVPDGDYVFADIHCADKTCDCRRIFIFVSQVNPDYGVKHIAAISYGWEPMSFYRNWSRGLSTEMLKEFKGPALDSYQEQTPFAPFFLEFFITIIEKDVAYLNRLKKHYKLFKSRIGMKFPKDLPFDSDIQCPCESAKKFKFCCGKKG